MTGQNGWAEWLTVVQQGGRRRALGLGSIGLILSALIVGGHPVLKGPPAIITLIGVGGMLESTLYLMFPGALPRILMCYIQHAKVATRIFGLTAILLGGICLYIWLQSISL